LVRTGPPPRDASLRESLDPIVNGTEPDATAASEPAETVEMNLRREKFFLFIVELLVLEFKKINT
jgi:hypothetical protein